MNELIEYMLRQMEKIGATETEGTFEFVFGEKRYIFSFELKEAEKPKFENP